MKKLTKISFIIFIPIIFGFFFQILGGKIENETLELIGNKLLFPGILVTMVILTFLGIFLMSTGKLADKQEGDNKPNSAPTREDEYRKIKEINSSRSYESHRKQGEYMMGHLAENYKNLTTKEKFLGHIFFAFLITDFILILVFTYLRIEIGIYASFATFAATILIAILVKIILQKLSINVSSKKIENSTKLNGRVQACVLSSSTSTGGSERRYSTRITGVTYKVIIIAEEHRYIAYSQEFYEEGERVTIAAIGKNRAAIVNNKSSQYEEDRF